MKKLILPFLLIVLFNTGYSQSIYYDAVEIANQKKDFISDIDKVLKSDIVLPESVIDELANFKQFLNDPFKPNLSKTNLTRVKKIMNFAIEELNSVAESHQDKSVYSNPFLADADYAVTESTISTIGSGLSLSTRLIDASAQFLVNRTKDELTLAFFDKFEAQFEAQLDSIEFKGLFPNTYSLLRTKDPFQIPSMGEMWIGAFKLDLREIPENLERVVRENDKYKEVREKEEFKAFLIAAKVFRMQEQGMHPAKILEYLSPQYDDYEKTIDKSINLINLFSSGLRDTSAANTWIPFEKIRSMEKPQIKFFIALLYQHDRHNSNLLGKISSSINIESYQRLFSTLVELSSILEHTEKTLESIKPENVASYTKFKEYSKAFFDVIEWGMMVEYQINDNAGDYYNSPYYKDIRPTMVNTFKTINAIQANEIGIGLLHGLRTIESILSKVEGYNPKTLKQLTYYGNFMVDITTADSTADIKAIIDNYAMPVGSYQTKRKSTFSIDLNGLPGSYLGYETDLKNEESFSFTYGLTAPIGFALSWGNKSYLYGIPVIPVENDGHSYSLFFPMVDIAAPFSYRLANDAQGLPENIKWEQIFSPGLHFVWGFKDSPLSLMAGGQFTPLLRKIDNDGNQLREVSTVRFGVTLAVDIPIFNLYRKE